MFTDIVHNRFDSIPMLNGTYHSIRFNGNKKQNTPTSLFLSPVSHTKIQQSFWDRMGTLGAMLGSLSGLLLLTTPLIRKNEATVSKKIFPIIQRLHLPKITEEKALQEFLSSKEKIEKLFKRAYMLSTFLLGINQYQTSLNSKQPSLLTAAIVRDIVNFIGIFQPATFLFLISLCAGPVYSMGKMNDINNNNHPERRREWDISRLSRTVPWHQQNSIHNSFFQELDSFLHFIADDARETFSLKHWRSLKTKINNTETWKQPQPYQNAISAQITALSALFTGVAFFKKAKAFVYIATLLALPAGFIASIPLITRALENQKEIDGQLVLAGEPLNRAGQLFTPTLLSNLYFLSGMAQIGWSLSSKGIEINSRRYRALVDEIEWLHKLALLYPSLKAATILQYFQTHPIDSTILKNRLGSSRIDYLYRLLQQADLAYKQHNIPLSEFLSEAEYVKDPHRPLSNTFQH